MTCDSAQKLPFPAKLKGGSVKSGHLVTDVSTNLKFLGSSKENAVMNRIVLTQI